MPWKMKENDGGFATCEKGNPIWVNESGEEKSVDFPAMGNALKVASSQAAERKAELNAIKERYKALSEIENLDEFMTTANAALEMVKNAPAKDKDIEEQVAARVKAAQDAHRLALDAKDKALLEKDKTLTDITTKFERETINHAFFQSAYTREKLMSATLAMSLFSSRFILKEGSLVGLDEKGQEIYGDDGSVASFDAALAKMVEASPDKAYLLKGSNMSGGGSNPDPTSGSHGKAKTLTDCKTDAERIAYLKEKAGAA